jgi:metal-dependent amidase/aminoacylase/carboxypeptidase family protein
MRECLSAGRSFLLVNRLLTPFVCAQPKKTGCDLEFIDDAYPETYNDPGVAENASKILRDISGCKVAMMKPVLGGEDFTRFLQQPQIRSII